MSVRPKPRKRRRRLLAVERARHLGLHLLLSALWATLLLPLWHSINHESDHVHGPYGTTYFDDGGANRSPSSRDHYGLEGGLESGWTRTDSSRRVASGTPRSKPAGHEDPKPPREPGKAPLPADHGAQAVEHFNAAFSFELPLSECVLAGRVAMREPTQESAPRPLECPRRSAWRCRGPPAS